MTTFRQRLRALIARRPTQSVAKYRSSSFGYLTRPGESAPPWSPAPLPEGVELMNDVTTARWIEESLDGWPWATVGALLPEGFDAYARILHPAYIKNDQGKEEAVSWATVASWSGRAVHPLMQFARIADLDDDPNTQPSWGTRPQEGTFDRAQSLADLLRSFTSTPDHCWFSLWEGFGGLDMVPAVEEAPRVHTPGRAYLLFRGPLDALMAFQTSGLPWGDLPNIWWPDDRAWCVATEIDLESTYVGGSQGCIDRILNTAEIEAFTARVQDRVDEGADTINV
jgi:hypothetical protein